MGESRAGGRGWRRPALLAALASCAAFCSLAGVAAAETVTLGPPITAPTSSGLECSPSGGGGCGNMLLSTELPSVVIAAPTDGTVVRWRIQGASTLPGYSLDVLHHNTNGTYTVTASTGSTTPAGAEIETLSTSLPIHAGEYIELNLPQQGDLATLEGETTYATFFPTLVAGETREPNNEFEYPFTFAFDADVELEPATPVTPPPVITPTPVVIATPAAPIVAAAPAAQCLVPKLFGKKLKTAKKKIRAGGCRVGKVTKKDGVMAKAGKVVKQGRKPGGPLAAGTKVSLQLG
jgi:hypothetical protein